MLQTLVRIAAVTAVATAATIITRKTLDGEIKWSFRRKDPVAKEGDEVPRGNRNQRDSRWKKH